ncbi:Hsp70 family protein [Hydrogenophaga pseudoflava]|uniref:Chaperone protein DnaK n=1 Tax=Hydrogenophaga pseudoflava TaxID=47421 RepID=A0A4P6X6P7_HYDPS|nr:Hsp70 family protein [Hydrogenophaga pseudoflava]QBM29394.1 Chaperone protein DnaK [Hydrogenophaga pseudoflava]
MHPDSHGTLGIDFGTSNSAMSWAAPDGLSRLIPLEGDAVSMPTAVFFNSEDHRTHFGRDAVAQYLAGTEGRLMRSLKSLLGSPLIHESTEVNHRPVSFLEIVTTFVAELRERATRTLGSAPRRVVMGRPVHFVDDDPARDAAAQQSLLEAAQAAGFREVSFQLEPIAAALDHERRLARESLVLIVDIGGGTSDFTVVRLGPDRIARPDRADDVLATTGVHIGGTDFDHRLSLEQVMPLLGYRHLGPQGREVPSRTFFDLSTWHLIQWLYLPKAVSQAQSLRVNYSDVRLHERLMRVLRERHGHHIAHEVEQAKIRCSMTDADTSVDLSIVEAALTAPLGTAALREHLGGLLDRTVVCAQECVQGAGLRNDQLDAVYLTGGSSALRPFQQTLRDAFPGVPLIEGDLFGGVASGLAYGTGRSA